MPTFTDGSLIAAGTGALVWAVLATDASPGRRAWAGLAGFIALEAAAFTRYTDIAVLGCAVVAVLAAGRLPAVRLPRTALGWWLGSAVVYGAGVALFDDLVYGGRLKSGYPSGLITFSLSAVAPNFRYMPAHLIEAICPCWSSGWRPWCGSPGSGRGGGQAATSCVRPPRRCRGPRPGRVLGRRVGAVRHLHLDGLARRKNPAGRPVLRAGDRRHLAAGRLAAGPRAAPDTDGRPHLRRGGRGDVRAGRLVLRQHAGVTPWSALITQRHEQVQTREPAKRNSLQRSRTQPRRQRRDLLPDHHYLRSRRGGLGRTGRRTRTDAEIIVTSTESAADIGMPAHKTSEYLP
jgi:hypothetical protein